MIPQLRVYVPPHPLIKHWLAVAREENTPPTLFKTAIVELGRWLTYEASREWLPTMETTIKTPLTECNATFINPQIPIAVIPILRAGLALLEGGQTILPLAKTYHLGLKRNETTLQPECYLNKLPHQFSNDTQIIIFDPMIATGGSMIKAIDEIVSRNANLDLVRIISVICAPPALKKISELYPNLIIYTAMIDEGLNDKGYILPGVGDAGDRLFGTFD